MYDSACLSSKNLEKYVKKQMLSALIDFAISHGDVYRNGEALRKIDAGKPFTRRQEELYMDECACLFPKWFNPAAIPQVLRSLWEMIASDEYFIPTLVQEYVLAKCIGLAADVYADSLIDEQPEPLIEPREREHLKVEMIYDLIHNPDFKDEPYTHDEAAAAVEDEIRGIEDFTGIIDTCFYDRDFEMLDDYTPHELSDSTMDDQMGLGIFAPARRKIGENEYEDYGMPSLFKTIVIQTKGER